MDAFSVDKSKAGQTYTQHETSGASHLSASFSGFSVSKATHPNTPKKIPEDNEVKASISLEKRPVKLLKGGILTGDSSFSLIVKGKEFSYISRKNNPNSVLNQGEVIVLREDVPYKKNAYQIMAERRLSEILTEGYEKVCKFISKNEDGSIDISDGGECQSFANFLAFGFKVQEGIDFKKWYETLPFAIILPFNEETLEWGDIVQFFSKDEHIHTLFYIGSMKYISKTGFGGSIKIQDLSSALESYRYSDIDNMRVIRLKNRNSEAELEYKTSYNAS